MKPRRILASEETAAVFDSAVAENGLAVISVQLDESWVTFKARFLERDPQRRFFVLDHVETHGIVPPDLLNGQYVGVSVRHRSRKVLFATTVEARGRFRVHGGEEVPATRYRWPESLVELQRRAFHRTPVPADARILASVWPGGVERLPQSQGTAEGVIPGEVQDISCGGALVRLFAATLPAWSENETLGVELHLPDGRPPLVLNAYNRGMRSTEQGDALSVGVQFVGLELSLDGRAVLQRLARSIQRLHRSELKGPRSAGGVRHRAGNLMP